ncbi:hypothetical protein M0R45_036837 [Rubus argutus]|uniref:Uncharacterized protein n=1 Tax=Rubus argutus TaxID=59490 RepID=A0AAW1VZ10_RUBAR
MDITRNFTFTDTKQVRGANNVLITKTKTRNYTLVAKDGLLQFVSADTIITTRVAPLHSSAEEREIKKKKKKKESAEDGNGDHDRQSSKIERLKMGLMQLKKEAEKFLRGACRGGGGYSSPVSLLKEAGFDAIVIENSNGDRGPAIVSGDCSSGAGRLRLRRKD